VWSWEAVQHGDAALVNETNLSGICETPQAFHLKFEVNLRF